MSKIIDSTEFEYITSFQIDTIATNLVFELYKNSDGQYLSHIADESKKTIEFYPDFEILHSVFSDDFTDAEMETWR